MIVTGTQNNKKHGGRPTVSEARRLSRAVTVKFSKKDYEILMNRSKKANKHLAEYIRDSALNSEVAQQPLEVVTKDYRMLVGMANNLNQLTKMAHQQGIYYVYIPLNSLLGDISHIVREYKQNTDKKRKKMIGKIMKAASFKRCVQYVTGKEDAKILASDGVLLTSTQDIIDSFEFQRQLNPRISKPVGHIALSFLPEDKDKLTDETMTRIAMEYMEMMGIRVT